MRTKQNVMKIFPHARLIAFFLICMAVPFSVTTQSKPSTTKKSPKFIYLLPEGFKGWICVDFGIADAPPLPREGDALVIRPRQGEVLKTSDTSSSYSLYGKGLIEVNGRRMPLPNGMTIQEGVTRSGPTEPIERGCVFAGNTDERDAADDPPGLANDSKNKMVIPEEERGALRALYKSTNGDNWKHRVGWMGPSGTECNWHGVTCELGANTVASVVSLDLFDNNLSGSIPEEIGSLKKLTIINLENNHLVGAIPNSLGQMEDLEQLGLLGNHFSGLIPNSLIERSLAGPLSIVAETSLLTDISEIDFESSTPSLLCARFRVILRSNDSAISYTERCRNATRNDRTTYCEVKVGQIGGFSMLGSLFEKNGYFKMASAYTRNMTEGSFEDLRVTKDGSVYSVSDYAGAGPFELWTIHRAIDGVVASADWKKISKQQKCPRQQ